MKNNENKMIASQGCNNPSNAMEELINSRIILDDGSTTGEFIKALEQFPKTAIVTNPRQDVFDIIDVNASSTVEDLVRALKEVPEQSIVKNTDPYTLDFNSNHNCSCTHDKSYNNITEPIKNLADNIIDEMYYSTDDYYSHDGTQSDYLNINRENTKFVLDAISQIQSKGSEIKQKIDAAANQAKSEVDNAVNQAQMNIMCEYVTHNDVALLDNIIDKNTIQEYYSRKKN